MIPDSIADRRESILRSLGPGSGGALFQTLAGGDVTKLLSVFNSFLENERGNIDAYPLPWRKRVWCYLHGFYSYSGVLYGLNRHNVGEYLSDLQRRKATSINEAHWKVAQLKLAFHEVLAHTHRHLLTEVVATIQDGEVYPLPEADAAFESAEGLLDWLTADSSLIVKPTGGWGGAGIFSIGRNDDGFTLDAEPISRGSLAAKLRDLDGYLLDRTVEQAPYAERISPHSANTIRVMTMIDPDTREPFVGAAVHRFGTDRSRPVDNWSEGGVCAPVDTETGRMGPLTAKPKSGPPSFDGRHPDTGTRVDGTTIPAWDSVRDELLSVADEYKHLWRYLGWDVVVTDEEGSFTILEANARPDIDLMQVHEPLLADSDVRRFYSHHGVV